MKTILPLMSLLFLLASITACNTVQGMGEDMEAGGKAVQRAAK